ncbi:unnamed protein product [Durusdinium trenchii]|uniref:Uncharacterized protein n=1 Tax=Durusdinium trenchii TaxID=1381693 RepID=A0ABP0RAX1_9DINO
MSHAKKCTTTTGLPPRSSSAFGGKEVWHSSGSGLIIVNVENSYAVRNWNKENPHLPIEVGQAILEVNGIRNSKRMLEEFRVTGQADLLIATELTQLSCVCGAITIFIPLASKHGWSFTAAGVLCAMQLR